MIGILSVTTFINFCLSDINVKELLEGFIPSIPHTSSFISVMGSIIMPQNIFLHASLVQTRSHLDLPKENFITIFRTETVIILIVSFFINLSLVGIFADPRYSDLTITLENAGQYLKEFLKDFSEYLWAFGLLAAGISSTATGALTGQYLMNGIFDFKFNKKMRILITRAITLIPCFIIIQASNVSSIINLLNIV